MLGGRVTTGSSHRHARRSGVAWRAGRMDERAPVPAPADSYRAVPHRGFAPPPAPPAPPAARFDPLVDPVAITGGCVIGDRIRVPAAWCAMAGCGAAFKDPAALGETDNRARAFAAGWVGDALGRLVCPACQRDRPVPVWWVLSGPGAVRGRRPAGGIARPPYDIPSEPQAPAGISPAPLQGRHQRAQRPRLLSGLVNTRRAAITTGG